MKISYNKLQTYFTDKLPTPEVLADAFTFHVFEIESLENEGDDVIMDIKVLPDRKCYANSYEGIAREVRTILGLKLRNDTMISVQYPRTITVTPAQINDVLGSDISTDEIVSILKRVDLKVERDSSDNDKLTLSIPKDREDLQDWRDIPEEVGRIYGYDKIEILMPSETDFKPKVEKTFYYSEKIKNILVDKGFSEVYTYSLVPVGVYEIEKPLASDKGFMRTNLTEGVVKALELNAKNADLLGLDIAINIFEIGKVFDKDGEHTSLCIGIKNIKKKQERINDKIKNVRDELFKELGADVSVACTIDDSGGLLLIDGKQVGVINNIEGALELNLDELIRSLPEPVSYADLNFGKASNIKYKKISAYPFIVRDIAVFVPSGVQAEDVWSLIKKGISDAGATDLLARYSLFDTFTKKGSDGTVEKISYAYRLVFQSMEKTLTDVEANVIMEKVNVEVKGNGWEVR